MSLDSIVDLQIAVDASAPTRASFGIPLLLAYHTKWPELTRLYTDLDGVTDDGFDSDDAVYKMVQILQAQDPHVSQFKIGRRKTAFTQIFTLGPLNVTVGFVYDFSVEGTDIEYTVQSGDDIQLVVDGISVLIDALPVAASVTCVNKQTYELVDQMTLIYEVDGTEKTTTFETADFVAIGAATAAEIVTAIDTDTWVTPTVVGTKVKIASKTDGVTSSIKVTGGTVNSILGFPTDIVYGTGALTLTDANGILTCTAEEGYLPDVDLNGMLPADLVFENTTADPGLSDDLDDIKAVDATWYGLALDSNSDAEVHAAALWIEGNPKIFPFASNDSDNLDAANLEDIGTELLALSYARTMPMSSRDRLHDYRAVAFISLFLAQDAGSLTGAFKTLKGISVDAITSGEYAALQGKGFTTYTNVGNRNITYECKTPALEFIDIPHFIDWLHAEIQQDVFNTLAANPKLPYTDEGVSIMTTAIEGALQRGVQRGGLRKTPVPTVTAPAVADIPTATRASRRLPDIAFTGELAGAIHGTTIRGKVTV